MEKKVSTLNFTDGIFSFPVKNYESRSFRHFIRKEEVDDDVEAPLNEENPAEPDWVVGRAYIPLSEFQGLRDTFTPGRTTEDVTENGHDLTIIYTKTLGDFICTWDSKKFLTKINEFARDYEKKLSDYVESRNNLPSTLNPVQVSKIDLEESKLGHGSTKVSKKKWGWPWRRK